MTDKKILFVSGGTSEVGTTLISRIGGEYEHIWIHCHSGEEAARALADKFPGIAETVQADFYDEKSVKSMIDRILEDGRIPNQIVHLASPKAFNLQFHKCRWQDYQDSIDVSLRSVVLLLEAFIPRMRKKKYGRVVFMLTSYILGGVPPKFQSPYITVKYALFGLMRNLAAEYAGSGITVNAVSPDMMETKFISEIEEIIVKKNAMQNPLGRNMTVDDVVPAIQYLLSDGAEAVTGQNIGVTGGVR